MELGALGTPYFYVVNRLPRPNLHEGDVLQQEARLGGVQGQELDVPVQALVNWCGKMNVPLQTLVIQRVGKTLTQSSSTFKLKASKRWQTSTLAS